MDKVKIRIIDDSAQDMRIDRWMKHQYPHITHIQVEKLLRTGQIRINGKRIKAKHRLSPGEKLRLPPLPRVSKTPQSPHISSQDEAFIRAHILYEDDELLALNKPAGLAVQGGRKTYRHMDTLLSALGNEYRLTHRLDRDTSGVLLIAKSAPAARWLSQAFSRKTQTLSIKKIYWGITNGVPKPRAGEIKGYIGKGINEKTLGRLKTSREIMRPMQPGQIGAKYAHSLYETLAKAGQKAAWVTMQPLTGRTHQLRLHMQLLGTPLAGDPKYLTDRPLPIGLATQLHLHARSVEIQRPHKHPLYIQAPLPKHIQDAFDTLGFDINIATDIQSTYANN